MYFHFEYDAADPQYSDPGNPSLRLDPRDMMRTGNEQDGYGFDPGAGSLRLWLKDGGERLMRPRRTLILIALACCGGLLVLLWPFLARWIDRQHGNVPIVFYGRIVDEQGNGLPGVHVTAEALSVEWFTPLSIYNVQYERRPLRTTTDEQGKFSFRTHGQRITQIAKQKAGWQAVPGPVGTTFSYPPGPDYPPGFNPRRDDPSNPITYVMRPKRQGR